MFKNIRQLTPFSLMLLSISFIMSISQSTMTTAYPILMRNFNVSATTVQWLTTGFMVAMTLVMPLSPWLLDNVHLKPLLNSIVAIFLIGTAIAMLSPNFLGIIVGRLLEGMAVGALFPTFQSVIMENTTKGQRGLTMGVVGLVMGSALAVGPIISGVILQWVSWRALFALFFFTLLILIIAFQHLIKNTHSINKSNFDWLSAITLLGFGGVLYTIASLPSTGFNLTSCFILIISILLLLVFIVRQQKQSQPFLNLTVFKYQGFLPGLILTGISYSGLIIATVLMPLFLSTCFLFIPTVVRVINGASGNFSQSTQSACRPFVKSNWIEKVSLYWYVDDDHGLFPTRPCRNNFVVLWTSRGYAFRRRQRVCYDAICNGC